MFRCLSLIEIKATFLWKDQFELIFQESLLKTNRFNCFITKSLRKIDPGQNLVFVKVNFFFTSEIGFFGLTRRVRLL